MNSQKYGLILTNNIKERNSSFELLRIICIILIIAHHYSVHGGYDSFIYNNISFGTIFIQGLSMFGRASCSVFAMISGYFLIERGDCLKAHKPFAKAEDSTQYKH